MYSGENVVILNYSEWIIQLGIYICYFLLLVLCTKLYIHSPSKAPNYIEYQTKKNWESKYIIDLQLKQKDEVCNVSYTQINLGMWSGISEYTCLCYNGKVFFTSSDKKVCKNNEVYNCFELDKINSENLTTYNDYIFCAKYSANSIISFHNNIINKLDVNNAIENYKSIQLPLKDGEQGIIDIKLSRSKNYSFDGYIDKGNGLYIKKLDKTSINIYEFNEFITGIHYLNELTCTCDEMTNNNPISNFYKNSRNIYYNNNKQCLKTKDDEYKKYYINDHFIRSSLIDSDFNTKDLSFIYQSSDKILNYYRNIQDQVDIILNTKNYPVLVSQKYLYGIGCQYYDTTKYYFSLFDYFYHNKNLSLCIVIFTLLTSVTAIIFVSFNLYQNCVDYPFVYLTFSLILVISLVSDATLTGVYLGFSVFLRNKFKKIFDECRIDFDGVSNSLNNNFYLYENYNKALPIENGLYEDLKYALYVSLIMFVTEIIILILLIIYFLFNCYRYTFISLKNERGNIIKSRKVEKKDLMDLVKML